MHIIHVDESAALGLPADQAATAAASVAAAAAAYCQQAGVQFHSVPLEDVFADSIADEKGSSGVTAAAGGLNEPDAQQLTEQRARLVALLAAVGDATGRADLVRHLRTHLLLRTAAALGCGRLARGDCATALAAHIVAAASKGCGYSLPGDVGLVDAR